MANDTKTINREPQPTLRLARQESPLQKINVSHMSMGLHKFLEERAERLGKKVPVYCRIVLEHAMAHQSDYEGPYIKEVPKEKGYSLAIHIPIKNKQFMKDLVEWDPYGHRKRTEIAISILRKHLEVRKW